MVEIEKLFHDWHYDHPRILYSLIRALRPSVVVEVGTYRGYAACYMAQALKENNKGKLYCIDDFSEGSADEWYSNLRQLELLPWATLLFGKSDEVKWPEHVDFAYIDGNHSLEYVEHDFEKVDSLGASIICLDDVGVVEGPAQFIVDLKWRHGWNIIELFSDNGLAICKRLENRPKLQTRQDRGGAFHAIS